VHVDGLQLGTVYHYRVVAHDTREGIVYTVDGPDQTFTTQTAGGGGLTLLDGRQWEMVSPADKQGAQLFAIDQYEGAGAMIQASAGGDALTYGASVPTEAEPSGYSNKEQVFSMRGVSGWASTNISLPHEKATGISVGNGAEYRLFSDDLSLAAVEPFGSLVSSWSPEASEATAFIRTDFAGSNGPCVSSCYQPLVTGKAGYANVPPGTVFGGLVGEKGGDCRITFAPWCGPQFIDGTSDLSHIVLDSSVALTLAPISGTNLYEWSRGKLALVTVMPGPDGKAEGGGLGTGIDLHAGAGTRHAISADGSRVVWTDRGIGAEVGLYMRDTVTEETVRLDAAQGGSGEGGAAPEFQVASRDGSRVFFTDTQPLTASAVRDNELYECEMAVVAGKLACKLSDLTPGGSAQVLGEIPGVSEDGSWVYFAANGVLASGAVQGDCGNGAIASAEAVCNLYVRHAGVTSLVAVLSGSDALDWSTDLPELTARVSPDGQWLAFMSSRELTGYDTRDAVTGEHDEEVYLYHADATGSAGRVLCASCDPTGARPQGIAEPQAGIAAAKSAGAPIAGSIPGWTPVTLFASTYQSRYLSDSGRLFFNSSDALVSQDVNGNEDVYEYEPPSVGGCTSVSVTFSERSDGCVGLISAGSSSEESGFLDASASGGDVFFLTASRLSGVDSDTALDIYDAHECTAGSPCFATPLVQPPVCDTGDSCKAAPSLQPAVFGAPSSATFSGAGNVTSPVGKPVVRSKGLTRAQKLARALRECRKRKGRRRAVCVRHAKARFAKSGSLRITASGKGGR
jgi:hypothetical protein